MISAGNHELRIVIDQNAPGNTTSYTAFNYLQLYQGTTSPPSITSVFCSLKSQGDADCSGVINLADFEVWRKEIMGTLQTTQADFDTSGQVNIIDFEIWRRTFLT